MKFCALLLSALLLTAVPAFAAPPQQPARDYQTAGRDRLGDFAPDFARYNDDILLGEVWAKNSSLSLKERTMITISAIMAAGAPGPALRYHIAMAKKNGVSREEMADLITHLAFYCGWLKAWNAFKLAKEVYVEDKTPR